MAKSPDAGRTGGALHESELNRLLEILAEQSSRSWKDAQEEVVDDVSKDPRAKDALGQLAASGVLLPRLIELWNRRLRLSLRQDIPRERVLCGFNGFPDVAYQLNASEAAEFTGWVASQPDNLDKDICAEARTRAHAKHQPLLTSGVRTPFEMLLALKQAFEHPDREWKPVIDEGLWDKARSYIEARENAGTRLEFRMGGASGNMAYVLNALGVDTTIHWPYHPREVASDADGIMRLMFAAEQKMEAPASEYGTYSAGRGANQPDPVRRSFVFDFAKGSALCGQKAQASSRVIFIIPAYLEARPRPWRRVVLRTTSRDGSKDDYELERKAVEQLPENAWPFFPVFSSKRVEGDALVVEIAGDTAMQRVAEQFDYFMLGGIQAIGHPPHSAGIVSKAQALEPVVRTIVKHALIRQLDILANNGVVVHWEVGGIKSPQLLDDLSEIARGRIESAGLSHSELQTITTGDMYRQTRYFLADTSRQPDILRRYHRAVHLARQLNLDQLYVHGNDVDLIVRRRTTRGALRQELAVTLFAKGVVLLALLKRSVEDWEEHIKAEKVPPVLKAEGFVALLELAKELALRRFPDQEPLERRTFIDIAESGYYYTRDADDYSAVVAPVMWPQLDIPFSTAGAGDITSSVVAVYSGK
jgi:ADP-dependent phosphofructokinase/glucokinase